MTPEGWAEHPLSALAEINPEQLGTATPADFQIAYLDIASIERTGVVSNTRVMPFSEAPSRARRVARSDDVVVSTVRPYLRSFARLRSAPPNLVASTGFAVVRPVDRRDSEFIYQHVLSPAFIEFLTPRMRGGNYPAVGAEDVASYIIRVPPPRERRKIAAILSSVDDAIEATQAVIDQLQVVKKAMMAELLTRGLPGRHTRFKMTEIGEVPEEWEVARLETLTHVITKGESPGWQGFEYQREGVLFVTSENVRDAVLELSAPKFIPKEFAAKIARSRLERGDVLVNIVGASIGRAALWEGQFPEANVNQAVAVVRPDSERLVPRLVLDALYSPRGQAYFGTSKVDNARPNVSLTNLRDFQMIVPKRDEQEHISAIAEAMDVRIAREAQVLTEKRRAKAALISVLLTGEVRVKPDEGAA